MEIDKYDLETEELLAIEHDIDFRNAVYEHWNNFMPLFQSCDIRGDSSNSILCGCLTQVKAGERDAYTKELTNRIRADARIPESPFGVTREVLKSGVFQEYQREMDRTFRNQD